MGNTNQPILCLLDPADECSTCAETVHGDWEIVHSPSERCDVRACTQCWKKWVTGCNDVENLRCICNKAAISLSAVQDILLPADFVLLAERWSLKTAQRLPNMITCPKADCKYGHMHDVSESGLQWLCFNCGTLACASCRAPWHADETCEQYMTKSTLNSVEIKIVDCGGERAIVQCPSCQVMMQKSEGCNHMTCPCGAEFCYHCQAYYLSAQTEGWQGFLAVEHKATCIQYMEISYGHVIEGLSWDEFVRAKLDVEFGSKHFPWITKYTSNGLGVQSYYLATGSGPAR